MRWRKSPRSRMKAPRKQLGFFGRMFAKVKSPAGIALAVLCMLLPFLLGGKVKETLENAASKVKNLKS